MDLKFGSSESERKESTIGRQERGGGRSRERSALSRVEGEKMLEALSRSTSPEEVDAVPLERSERVGRTRRDGRLGVIKLVFEGVVR